MNWVSFVYLLALLSTVFAQSYREFSQQHRTDEQVESYGRSQQRSTLFDDPPEPETHPLSEADLLCQDKRAGHTIPIRDGRKYVVCTADSKGDVMSCPKGLIYSMESSRCEYKSVIEDSARGFVKDDPCASQPCLYGGTCYTTKYTYECKCTPGYSGRTCELDSSVCEQEKPCGDSPDNVCQSFIVGSALKYVCILQKGLAYCSSQQHAYQNPCLTSAGMHPLGFSNKGYINCNEEKMYIHSCDDGLIWDKVTRVCAWPDMTGTQVKPGQEPLDSDSQSFQPMAQRLSISSTRQREGDFRTRFTDGDFRPTGASDRRGGAASPVAAGDFRTRFTDGDFNPSGSQGGRMRGNDIQPPRFRISEPPGATGFRSSGMAANDVRLRGLGDQFGDSSIRIPVAQRPINQEVDRGGFNPREFILRPPGANFGGGGGGGGGGSR